MPTDHTPLDHRSDAALGRLARATRPDVASESLAVLARRDAPTLPALGRELVVGHADDRVRARAAVALGRIPGRATQEALETALATDSPDVLRRVVGALGRVGDASALASLDRLRLDPTTPVGRDLRMARTLLSYRHGLEVSLVEPVDTTKYSAARGRTIDWARGGRMPKRTIVASAERELPGLALSQASVHPYVCSGHPGALALDAGLRGQAPDTVLGAPRLLGALLRERVCSERYSLDAYLLADQRDGGRVWLVRPDGTLVHSGRTSVDGPVVSFVVDESRAPYGSPVRVTGGYDTGTGRLTVDEALVASPSTHAVRATPPALRPVG
ncbi:HEAT repeat domain-containing protein [Phycicoccus sonneratiae]|uniref:HEAT repeat domain-containing protein n=1 Tax=Phycicoccus sonneratiae TaxID=2807628 RepID=A0ABS2CJG6_9MICO|nr:HEAT repeat domain-containing protein [Phycicoccus sonneraticus]MBM6400004.1 HEAT repeat domain-containing protein [Phycicoccus sonneraticus]